jgi:hypothetical protein
VVVLFSFDHQSAITAWALHDCLPQHRPVLDFFEHHRALHALELDVVLFLRRPRVDLVLYESDESVDLLLEHVDPLLLVFPHRVEVQLDRGGALVDDLATEDAVQVPLLPLAPGGTLPLGEVRRSYHYEDGVRLGFDRCQVNALLSFDVRLVERRVRRRIVFVVLFVQDVAGVERCGLGLRRLVEVTRINREVRFVGTRRQRQGEALQPQHVQQPRLRVQPGLAELLVQVLDLLLRLEVLSGRGRAHEHGALPARRLLLDHHLPHFSHPVGRHVQRVVGQTVVFRLEGVVGAHQSFLVFGEGHVVQNEVRGGRVHVEVTRGAIAVVRMEAQGVASQVQPLQGGQVGDSQQGLVVDEAVVAQVEDAYVIQGAQAGHVLDEVVLQHDVLQQRQFKFDPESIELAQRHLLPTNVQGRCVLLPKTALQTFCCSVQ